MAVDARRLLFTPRQFRLSLLGLGALGYNTAVMKRRRALLWLFLAVGLANLIRAALAPQVIPALAGWSLALPLYWLAALYLVWGVVFVGAAFAIGKATRQNQSWRGALPLALGYQLALWALALGAYRASYARSLWGRDLVLTAAFLAMVAFLARDEA